MEATFQNQLLKKGFGWSVRIETWSKQLKKLPLHSLEPLVLNIHRFNYKKMYNKQESPDGYIGSHNT